MAGDEFYDDDVTSGPIEPRPILCSCSRHRDDGAWEKHAADCDYRLAIDELLRTKGRP